MNDLVRFEGMSLAETHTLADTFVKSGFFSDTRAAAQAVVKILAGRELGFGPMASMTGVYIVKGRVSLSANLLAAAIKRSGRYNYRVSEMTDERCMIEFTENDEPCGESAFTIEDAKGAGLLANQTWKQYPRNMLFARALSNGARWYCPDVFGGPLYTPEELGALVDGETGEVIEAEPRGNGRRPQRVAAALRDGTALDVNARLEAGDSTPPEPATSGAESDEPPWADPEPMGQPNSKRETPDEAIARWRDKITSLADDAPALVAMAQKVQRIHEPSVRAEAVRMWAAALGEIGTEAELIAGGKAVATWPSGMAGKAEARAVLVDAVKRLRALMRQEVALAH